MQNRRFWARPSRIAHTFYEPAFSLIVTFSVLVLTGGTGPPLQYKIEDFGLGLQGRPYIAQGLVLTNFYNSLLLVDLVKDLGDLGPGEGLFGVEIAFLISY